MWTPTLLHDKLKALLIHLGVSLIILLGFVALIWFVWYPAPLFFTDGGWQGLRIIALIDLVLGPALTFLIYNPAKSRKALSFDFACIGFVQALALTYGVLQVESVRPWVVAYEEGRLHVHPKSAYVDQEIAAGGWTRLGEGPIYRVYTRAPATEEEKSGVVAFGMFTGLDTNGLHFLYEPQGDHLEEIMSRALDMPALAERDAGLRTDYQALLARHPGVQLWFFPLQGFFANAIVALDARGQIVDTLYREAPAGASAETLRR